MQAIPSSKFDSPIGRLRVLETTDLHMQLLDYDYFADKPDHSIGLIGLADQIKALRDEDGVTTLLFDNGDLLQGNPLADHIAAHAKPNETHPMIAALNTLQYDAMTLGNHEFDYGLDFLRNTLTKAGFPVVSANISCDDGDRLAVPFCILDREILCNDGNQRPIKIGITGFAPPQIADWDDARSSSGIKVDDIVASASRVIPQIRAAGADVIIALCHSGIGADEHLPRMENAALPLARVDGIDALLLGHTHEAFPDPAIPSTANADYGTGLLHGKPAVMATFCGKSLGVLELDLKWDANGWYIAGQRTSLVPTRKSSEDSPLRRKLRGLVSVPHNATLNKMRAPIAQTQVPIASYFATIQPDLSQQILARAMKRAVATALKDSAQLPLLAAKSSFRFGGRSGLGHYIDIPPGPITLRDAAAIFPFTDALCAVRRTGRQLRLWLERAAAHYNQVQPGVSDQPLINPQSAGYNCDTIFGLSYQIDLTQPARFNTHGVEINAKAARIQHIRYQDQAVGDDDIFLVATNSFRAKGGGGFPTIAPADIALMTTQSVRGHLIDYLTESGTIATPVHATWSFAPIPRTAARFASAPAAQQHMIGPVTHIGPGPDGFDTYQIAL
ncbi:bifunctional 2',3'-cyclic-nucleotide 2'-phosphodiesterase/3'-nucleotidase [Roseobacter sp. CCS2]|uniref:bifunctional 2',3'-cyclic-nucleotide 2'-phosphodiesterase/3'-nucleotidase n=1 Tax=Roseobacter sp. CCS2 TaxID=391593 RepID=UPI0000F40106|nr:bifunctional 2',3'-cyclic-nucleotide 2'-phosphodiesterase/3'-nucleotidase [Roseobacter sp. CCS2]EBA13202.1 Twin-arginine translocation pathway signal [Roseobacter sp. CCS2]